MCKSTSLRGRSSTMSPEEYWRSYLESFYNSQICEGKTTFLDRCGAKGTLPGRCDALGKCQPFYDVSFKDLSEEMFGILAPILVEEAKKWHAGEKSKYFLSASQVNEILSRVVDKAGAWWSTPLVELLRPKNGSKIVIVGNTHGQLEDVLRIFEYHGHPSKSTVYLVNGDVCDRGMDATTIWVLLFVYKLSNEAAVHINRGNHEDDEMNQEHGFRAEVMTNFASHELHQYPRTLVVDILHNLHRLHHLHRLGWRQI
eukprot:GEMP01020492.1.p1 GENE.GEMP01020492.1~~GEMP01020492.1.p1  ORF type:complete len:256 (+),score=32.15 GEMP01020492.1:73-840(+)